LKQSEQTLPTSQVFYEVAAKYGREAWHLSSSLYTFSKIGGCAGFFLMVPAVFPLSWAERDQVPNIVPLHCQTAHKAAICQVWNAAHCRSSWVSALQEERRV